MRLRVAFLATICFLSASALSQVETPGGGREQTAAVALYRRLGSVGLDPTKVYRIRDAHLDREDLHLSLASGTIAFTQSVDGRITGAAFQGRGEVLLSPPDRVERWSMALFTGAAILEEQFTSAYLRFNDETFAELKPFLRPFEAAPPAIADPDEAASERAESAGPATPQEFVENWNVTARTLSQAAALRLLTTFGDAESMAADGTMQWHQPANDHILYARVTSRHFGVFDLSFDSRAPEQILVARSTVAQGQTYYDVWASFPSRSARSRIAATKGAPSSAAVQTQAAAEMVRDPVLIPHYTIHASVHPPHELQAESTLELETSEAGHRVLLFELSRFLQVKQVTLDGHPLEFVQNEALEGSELSRRGNDIVAVVFPAPLEPHRHVQLHFTYAGDVLSDAGGGLLYVGARGIWYPNRGLAMSNFDIQFRYPAAWTLVATGKRVSSCLASAPGCEGQLARGSEAESENEVVAHYVSERPIPVAGFNLGRYVKAEAKAGNVLVETYAAHGVETSFPRSQTVVPDRSTDPFNGRSTPGLRVVPTPAPAPSRNVQELAAHTAHTIDFLAARLGPFPYSKLAMTQMPGTSSQGWPGLVYLSSMAFVDPAQRGRTRAGSYEDLLFSRLMPAHETAHQWFGDLLLWKSYREQWLVEALSNYCVLLMIEQQDQVAFRDIMEQYRHDLLTRNKDGHPVTDAGPVTLGLRLNSSLFPDAFDTIAYGRGTWLFHMLRHMLVDNAPTITTGRGTRAKPQSNEDPFFTVLRTLRERFEGKEITTRDVQQAFEEAIPEGLRYEGHKSLEWFFDSWVNGTAIPRLSLADVKIINRSTGRLASGRIIQKNAPDDLVTSVPVYADIGAQKPVLLGRIFAEGSDTPFHFSIPAGTRKLLLDPYDTILRQR